MTEDTPSPTPALDPPERSYPSLRVGDVVTIQTWEDGQRVHHPQEARVVAPNITGRMYDEASDLFDVLLPSPAPGVHPIKRKVERAQLRLERRAGVMSQAEYDQEQEARAKLQGEPSLSIDPAEYQAQSYLLGQCPDPFIIEQLEGGQVIDPAEFYPAEDQDPQQAQLQQVTEQLELERQRREQAELERQCQAEQVAIERATRRALEAELDALREQVAAQKARAELWVSSCQDALDQVADLTQQRDEARQMADQLRDLERQSCERAISAQQALTKLLTGLELAAQEGGEVGGPYRVLEFKIDRPGKGARTIRLLKSTVQLTTEPAPPHHPGPGLKLKGWDVERGDWRTVDLATQLLDAAGHHHDPRAEERAAWHKACHGLAFSAETAELATWIVGQHPSGSLYLLGMGRLDQAGLYFLLEQRGSDLWRARLGGVGQSALTFPAFLAASPEAAAEGVVRSRLAHIQRQERDRASAAIRQAQQAQGVGAEQTNPEAPEQVSAVRFSLQLQPGQTLEDAAKALAEGAARVTSDAEALAGHDQT